MHRRVDDSGFSSLPIGEKDDFESGKRLPLTLGYPLLVLLRRCVVELRQRVTLTQLIDQPTEGFRRDMRLQFRVRSHPRVEVDFRFQCIVLAESWLPPSRRVKAAQPPLELTINDDRLYSVRRCLAPSGADRGEGEMGVDLDRLGEGLLRIGVWTGRIAQLLKKLFVSSSFAKVSGNTTLKMGGGFSRRSSICRMYSVSTFPFLQHLD
jgi:hypothetical protein